MRTSTLTLGAALSAAAPALASPPPSIPLGSSAKSLELQIGASFWGRYELRDNYDRLGVSRGRFLEGDWLVYRARLDLRTTPLAIGDLEASVFFSPQADGFWGDQLGTIATPDLGIYRGFLRLFADGFRIDLGRFDLNYGDALVIGDLRWHQTGRSFDGVHARFGPEATWVDVFLTQLDEGLRLGAGNPDPFAPGGNPDPLEGDVGFGGIYASLGKLLGEETTLEPYLLGQAWLSNGPELRPALQSTLGVRALQKVGILDLRLEAGLQLGRRRVEGGGNPEVFAGHADAEIGVTPTPGLRISLEGLYASGDDPTTDTVEGWDELYPTAHKFLGLMDVMGIRTNVASAVAHVAWRSGPVKLTADVHGFLRPEVPDGRSELAGVETDVNLHYIFGSGLEARALYAFFVPASDHGWGGRERGVDELAQYVELQLGFEL